MWGEHGWNVRLETLEAVQRAVGYVEQNPVKEGKKEQSWSLVTPFDYAASLATRVAASKPRKIGGAALRSKELKARRKRRG